MIKFLILTLLLLGSISFAETMTRSEFCHGQSPIASNSEIAQKLKAQKISFSGTPTQWTLLQYISSVMTEFQINGPVHLFFSTIKGPQKITKNTTASGTTLLITADAEELLFGKQIVKYRQEVCSPNAPRGTIEFTVTFTNTVYEQLLRALATKDQMETHLTKRTGWKILNTSDPTERPFRLEELITIEKQVIDIPAPILKSMKLKSIARKQYGAKLSIAGASAIYSVRDEKITFADKTFIRGSDIYGEGTVLHEMGHAYWYGKSDSFRQNFTNISWKEENSKYVLKQNSSNGFVSAYAMKEPSEDFAEHFSAFIHEPEWLKTKAIEKYNFFKKYSFTDDDYFTTVAENAKTFVDSKNPDTKPPWLELDVKKSFSHELTLPKDDSKAPYPLKISLRNASDDISGFDEIMICLENVENAESKIFLDAKALGTGIKNVTLEGVAMVEPEKISSGFYKVKPISLTDRADNTTFYKTDALPQIYLKGLLGTGKRIKPVLDQNRIKINSLPVIDNHQGVEIVLPIAHAPDFKGLHITWDIKGMDHPTTHVCNNGRNDRANCFISKPGDSEIRIRSYFWKEYASGAISLTHVLLQYAAGKINGEEDFGYPITQTIGFNHNTGHAHAELVTANVNSLQLSVVKGPNENGGDTSIKFQMSVTTPEIDNYKMFVDIRGPSGKRLLFIANKRNSTITNGQITFNFPLFINQEKGEYMVEAVEIETEFVRPKTISMLMDLGHAARVKTKLIERGIRKTFKIKDDNTILLN